MRFCLGYISVAAVTAAYGSALTAGHFWKDPKVTKRSSPHHSVPRLGSACPHSGFGAWAAALGHPWPSAANPASCPRGFTGRRRSKAKAKAKAGRGGLKADRYCVCRSRFKCGRGLAPDGGVSVDADMAVPLLSGASPLPQFDLHTSGRYQSAANSASCRVTHGFKPAFGQRGFTGRLRSKAKAGRGGLKADRYCDCRSRSKCGRGLAPDGGVSVDASVAVPLLSGASPLPQFDLHTSGRYQSAANSASCRVTHAPKPVFGQRGFTGRRRSKAKAGRGGLKADRYCVCRSRFKCGRGLAPDGGVSVDASVAVPLLSGASPLPQFDLHTSSRYRSAANSASCRVTHALKPVFGQRGFTGRRRSKAKAGRDGLRADRYCDCRSRSKCGRGLAPDGGVSVDASVAVPLLSGASPLPQFDLQTSGRYQPAFDLLLILISGAPSNTLAERRLESVGNPAGRRVSRPGPRMAHDGGPRIQAGVRAHRA
ncbi:hypothetical protein PS720_04147 [Pseudomonas fluorescens]|nr:hypothetical protein PS720_04147 [Pseudomonas fluorescens]